MMRPYAGGTKVHRDAGGTKVHRERRGSIPFAH